MLFKKKYIKRLLWGVTIIFVMMNAIAIFHSYKFTHFENSTIPKTKDPKKLTFSQKVSTVIFGVNNPRPVNLTKPAVAYKTIYLQSNKKIECWEIAIENPKGTVLLYHGFSGSKSAMLDKSDIFNRLGFNTVLVDFMGSGGSEGNQTTIGYFEAEQVKTSYEYIASKGEKNIYLFGTSMGAVAIMKAMHDYTIQPKGIILECPFGSMYKTVCARFKTMNAPVFPMAGMLVFWGGVQNGFWAFGHNPTEYAKDISCPTLLMYGKLDEKVSQAEINDIYINLKGKKVLKVYELAGHENYISKYKKEWTEDINQFLVVE